MAPPFFVTLSWSETLLVGLELTFDISLFPLILAVFLLDLADDVLTPTLHLLDLVVGQIVPFLLDTALELMPIALDLVPDGVRSIRLFLLVHLFSFRGSVFFETRRNVGSLPRLEAQLLSAMMMPIPAILTPQSPGLTHTLMVTIGLSLIAFLATGGALVGFFRSLMIESDEGRVSFGRRSRVWLGLLIALILIFSALIAFIAIS